MGKIASVLLVLFAAIPSLLFGETRSGAAAGTLESVTVEAATKVDVIYARHGESRESFQPYPFDGDWSFTWKENRVEFSGEIHLGDYQTTSDAGSMGGVTIQTYYDFIHYLSGSGEWNALNRTMTFEIVPEEPDDSRASLGIGSRDAVCEKVSGMFAGKSCKAFLESSPGLEGLRIHFEFSEELDSFQGEAVLIQYGGKGMTESRATIRTTIHGSLNEPAN